MGYETAELYEKDQSIINEMLKDCDLGLDWTALKDKGWTHVSDEPLVLWEDRKFATPSGKIEIASEQVHDEEHLGRLLPMIEADGIKVCTVALDQAEAIPNLDGFDAVWALGGPMQVWEEDRFPWLVAEKAAIREAVVERKLPCLTITFRCEVSAQGSEFSWSSLAWHSPLADLILASSTRPRLLAYFCVS